ncbi:leucyl aminopeptidase family protein [Coralloluteibacterium stylophorae]|uniref:Leucyl aminopeptidase family protein n=1 Tax=Coralloluteibacterium stylophorae TaxID=1776034 RepID=A0A8J8AYM6_9GAMM|nr:leucyl aminopeptidase family protein [Coralloluteibacterium stylophorae]MBS7458229.1 leucyl aminopeptidase family protein [Coralloluteibacterium stylophorae]
MTRPACFAPASAGDAATPLYAFDRAGFDAHLETQDARVRTWCRAQGFAAEPGTALLVPGDDGRPACAFVGVVAEAADPHALAHAPWALPPGDYRLEPGAGLAIDPARAALGWGLGAYRFERYRKAPRAPARLVLDEAWADGEAAAMLEASGLVRDLVNTPTEHMGPEELEAACRALADRFGAGVRAVVGNELLDAGFPAIHAVGRASHRAPRLIELTWGDEAHPALTLVGKGVCFDTGGLDLKGADGMRNMKKDMGGAAHAIGLAQLVMARRLPVRLTLLVAAVENAIGPDAFRPGEVLATRAGLSVEVDNTDAEGRLVLCDALAYAAETPPALLMDFATLTGAARIALGPELPALYATDEAAAQAWLDAGLRDGDPVWRMPLWKPYFGYLKSGIADFANSGASRMAGSIVAAVFLQRFVPDSVPWTHLDVYAWCDSDRPGHPAGGDAQGLRSAFAMLRERFGG